MLFRSVSQSRYFPKIQSLVGQTPMAQQLQAAMMAHINEHLGFEYRKQIEMQLGMTLPPQHDESGEDVHMAPEVEEKLAPLLAQAAQRLLAQNQQQVAQQQAQQQAQDPLIQMQQQELQLKAEEVQIKKQKIAMDAAAKADQIEIEKARIEAQERIAGLQAGVKAASEKSRLDAEMEIKGIEVGSSIAKDRMEMLRPQPKPTKQKG